MRITLGVTDNEWADFLRGRPEITDANFWVPSGQNFTGRARLGEPFLFKTKSPRSRIVGGGYFEGFYERRVSEAWAVFGEGNGVATEADLEARIQEYRARSKKPYYPDPTIGCVVLRDLFFADAGNELPQPERWGRSIVQGKTYTDADPDWDEVEHVFRVLTSGAQPDLHWADESRSPVVSLARYGAPSLRHARLGQPAFRWLLEDEYDSRCAITGSANHHALEAAHIIPYADGGTSNIGNGLLLRRDVHRLFDRGYLGIAEDYRLLVSPQLHIDTGNGVEFYERAQSGAIIRLPDRAEARPDPAAIAWHREHVFLSA